MSSGTQEIKCPHCGTVFNLDEAGYADILNQVRGAEFETELHKRLELELAAKEAQSKTEVIEAKAAAEKKAREEASKLEAEIIKLKGDLSQAKTAQELAVTKATQEADKREQELKAQLDAAKTQSQLELAKAANEFNEKLRDKDGVIQEVQNNLDMEKNRKAMLSTKGIGEDFELWCADEFNKVRAMAFPGAEFEKDNDAKSGSKGDYIFRNYVDGIETLSIMFEMKNEASTTATKKKNEDFFKELDKDRNEKGCEYAILVSTLEKESDLYNQGITDVSHRYPKMLVVRPWAFIQIIGILRNASLNVVEAKNEVERLKEQNVDVSEFVKALDTFKAGFAKNYKDYESNANKALKSIDDSIKKLEETREALRLTFKHLTTASNKVEDVSIKSLTKGNPTMEAKFKELGQA